MLKGPIDVRRKYDNPLGTPWARLLAYVTGLINQELLLKNRYLVRAVGALARNVVDVLVHDLPALRLREFAEDVQLVFGVLALVLRRHSSVERYLANGVFRDLNSIPKRSFGNGYFASSRSLCLQCWKRLFPGTFLNSVFRGFF
jgi:hypothetical protein